jgi:very-long-chain (3R)-3-hydroxyacyl-CoA dehydratase
MAEQTKATRDEQARGTSSLRTLYLTVFNISFAALWLWIGVSALLSTSSGRFVLFEVVEPQARWVQTLTLIEVVHAAIGTSSSSLLLIICSFEDKFRFHCSVRRTNKSPQV